MVAGIILAAGESRRMGSPKPLLPFEGKTFLERLLEEFLASSAEPIVVVLGHGADRILEQMEWREARPVVNRNYGEGMLSSIRTGLGSSFRVLLSTEFSCVPSIIRG